MGYRRTGKIMQKPIILKQKDMEVFGKERKKIAASYHDISENKGVIVV
jgi:hypothetical protein